MVSRRISHQLLRSGTSVIANYVEVLAGTSKKDFAKFINIALKSANESKLWLNLLMGSNKSKIEETNILINEFDEIPKILAASLITIRKSLK